MIEMVCKDCGAELGKEHLIGITKAGNICERWAEFFYERTNIEVILCRKCLLKRVAKEVRAQ